MKIALLAGGFLFGSCGTWLQAGSVFLLANGSEVKGTLTLNTSAIHVEGGSPPDINLADILEADFGETPFQLNYFSSASHPNQLPPDLKGEDIGHPAIPGSFSYADGVVTLTGAGVDLQRKELEDQYFVFGQPWTGSGQWTARLKTIDNPLTQVGPTLRQTLEPLSIFQAMGVSGQGGGLFLGRGTSGSHAGWTNFSSDPPPIWVRMIRSANSYDFEISSDGIKWEIINQGNLNIQASAWLGFFLNSYSDKRAGKATLDQLSLIPGAAEPETVPPGVLLRGGSFVSGSFDQLDAKSGNLNRNGKIVSLTLAQIAAVVLHPVTRRQLAAVGAQTGLIMKNGDFLAADIQSIHGSYLSVSSLLLGLASYYGESVRAVVLQPVQSLPSDYEVRLKDGSLLRTTSLGINNGDLSFGEVSGAAVTAAADEVAQVRAGLSHVQPLIDLPWKATPPPVANQPQVTQPPPAATNAAPQAAPAPVPPPPADTDVLRWAGPNQEQILAVPAGTSLEFPLTGNFSALALRIALAPDAPPNAQVVVRLLVDGREVGRTPAFKGGDQPAFVELTLQSPKSVTIETDSNIAGIKTLLIDPVAIRQP